MSSDFGKNAKKENESLINFQNLTNKKNNEKIKNNMNIFSKKGEISDSMADHIVKQLLYFKKDNLEEKDDFILIRKKPNKNLFSYN